MASERFSSRECLLEVIRILQEHTDKKEMMTIHEIQVKGHHFFYVE